MMINRKNSGFTIVELLIVVVVVAILAAIATVAYSGVQQRARNSAIVTAAGQSMTAIKMYLAANGAYPYTGGGNACITSTSGCVRETGGVDSAVATFDNNIATVATAPKSVAKSGTAGYGVMYNYLSTRTYNGVTAPAMLFYYLEGVNQNCGVAGVMTAWDIAVTSARGYTSGNAASTGKTLCFVSVPGPSV